VAGYHLVIFEQVGEGRVYHSKLDPGERPPEVRLFDRMFKGKPMYVSIPVNANSSMRHTCSSSVPHASEGHAFDIEYILSFVVASPETVATRWVEDPLRKIECEMKRIFDGAGNSTDWERLEAAILHNGGVDLTKHWVADGIDDLREFSAEHGIHVKDVRMSLRLSRTDAGPHQAAASLMRDRVMETIRGEQAKHEMLVKHNLNLLNATHHEELRAIQRPGEVADAGVKAVEKAVISVGENTHRGEDLVRTLRDVVGVVSQQQRGGIAGPAAIGTRETLSIAAGASATGSKVGLVVDQAAVLVSGLPGEDTSKRELLSILLHSIAEVVRDKDADPADAESYANRAADLVADWRDLDTVQFRELNQLTDLARLRERLR
jgi:hypothetical protein